MSPPIAHAPPTLTPMRAIFLSDPNQGKSPNGAWDQMWKEGITPWDGSGVQPALRELVEKNWGEVKGISWDSLKGGKALVPGCGRGYDAIYFASLGFDSLGIDLSPTAINAANSYLSSLSNAPENVKFEACDFFTFQSPEEGFTLAYDYTFLCALPPSLKGNLGERYAELIKKGGVLITIMWPLVPVGDNNGPPYHSPVSLYETTFSPYFDLVYLGDNNPNDQAPTGPGGNQKVGVWVRKSS